MASSVPESAPGLRERKKAQTRSEIAQAAYEVVRDHGIAGLSAEAVSQRAGVSRRTFFNYFTTVESSLEPVIDDFLTDIETRLRETPIEGDLMAALSTLVLDDVDELGLLERITVLGVAAYNSSAHRGLFAECSHNWIESFSARLEALTETDDDLYVTGAATALISAAEASLRVWLRRTGGEFTPQTLALRRELLAEAIRRLGVGFNAR